MKNINDEIKSMQSQIKFKQNLINQFDSSQEKYKELIEITKKEILALERKVTLLEERKKTGTYIPKKPELGDDRYKNFLEKNAIDILRTLYYDFFHKDPSLSLTANDTMFGDPTLPICTSSYLIRGEIPFNLMLTSNYEDYNPNDNYSVGIQFDKKDLSKEIGLEYLKLMSALIKRYSNNEINFICCDGMNRKCTLSYIGDNDFSHYTLSNERMYYEFFNLLCDNNWRNIIHIGDTMKQNTRAEEIEQVDSKIVIPHIKFIAKNLGITTEELMKSNEELCNQVFTLSKK